MTACEIKPLQPIVSTSGDQCKHQGGFCLRETGGGRITGKNIRFFRELLLCRRPRIRIKFIAFGSSQPLFPFPGAGNHGSQSPS